MLLLTAATVLAQPATLEVLDTIDGGDEAMLYRPSHLLFAPDGTCYVLNAGDCRVLQFDADWSLVRAFGHEGEGPGEFTNPTGMILRDGDLWIFEMMRATRFSLTGEYRRTVTSRLEMHAPQSTDQGILVRLGGGADRMAALLDDDLDLIRKLGPACPHDGDFLAEYRACGFVETLPHPDYLALLLNPIDGRLWALDDAGDVAREVELVSQDGRSSMTEPDDDGRVTMQFTLVMGTGGVDARGLFWSMPMSEEEDPEGLQLLVVRDRDFQPMAEYVLPEGVNGFGLVQAPDGRLLFLDGNASLIHVCAYPEELAAR